jgi:hypothetical protein
LPVGFIGLVLHFSADRMQMVVVIEPIIVTISNEAEYGFGPGRLHPDDDQTRQQILVDRKRDYAGIEMAERHSPLLRHQLKRTLLGFEEP